MRISCIPIIFLCYHPSLVIGQLVNGSVALPPPDFPLPPIGNNGGSPSLSIEFPNAGPAESSSSELPTLAPLDGSPQEVEMSPETRKKLEETIPNPEERLARLEALAALAQPLPPPEVPIDQPAYVNHSHLNVDGDDILEVNEKLGVEKYFYQGDIHLTDEQLDELERSLRENVTEESGVRLKRQWSTVYPRWPDNTIYYMFDSRVNQRQRNSVAAATSYLQERTCINFVNNIASRRNYVRVIDGAGCYSVIGMTGGAQDLSIGSGCEVIGSVAHELAHALGTWHQHQRRDRDNYLIVDTSDVDAKMQINFAKATQSREYTLYEYGSMMQYPANAFTRSGSISMEPKDKKHRYTMGCRQITFYDVYMINQDYGCNAKCQGSTTICANGGYPNPRNCSVCNCPLGYAGNYCDQRPEGNSGRQFNATSNWQEYVVSIGDFNTDTDGVRDTYTYRIDWIMAPPGKKIQLQLRRQMTNTQCMYGCSYNGIELKVDSDQRAAGVRICCEEYLNVVYNSSVNPTPAITYNRYFLTGFDVAYRYVDDNDPAAPATVNNATTAIPIGAEPPKSVVKSLPCPLCGFLSLFG